MDPKRKRVDFKEKRHVDSGVWMGSDESAAESSLPSDDAPTWGEDLLKAVLDPQPKGKSPIGSTLSKEAAAPVPAQFPSMPFFFKRGETEQQRAARAIVNDCLERGDDSVDLG